MTAGAGTLRNALPLPSTAFNVDNVDKLTGPAAVGQFALPFQDPFEPRRLPTGGWPFWTLNTLRPGRRMEQRPYRLHELEWVLQHVNGSCDTYMSQAFFSKPCRRALHVAWLTHAYVDLDLYKLPVPPNPGEAGILLRLFCRDEGIPEPSVIVSSGRGLYLKWMWSSPLPRAAAGRAVAVNRALVRRFEQWGADPAAVDVSRILRVVGTTNTRSGGVARILHQAERDGAPLTHDFDLFADEVLPFTLEQVRSFRDAAKARQAEVRVLSQERARRQARQEAEQARRGNQRAFCPEDWHWGVLEDLRRLAELRSPDGRVQPGSRALFGHIGACQLARVIPAGQLWHEVREWSRILLPADYREGAEFRQHCSTLLREAQRAAKGERDTYRGRRVTPVYTYRASTVIERLGVTPDEMRQMTRLIDGDEKRRRDREATMARRREAGVQEWGVHVEKRAEAAACRAARARALRTGGMAWDEVAKRMELGSPDAARKLASRAE